MSHSPVDVVIQLEAEDWRAQWPRHRSDIGKLMVVGCPLVRFPKGKPEGVMAIVLADDKRLKGLNRQFRGKNKPTNVLSFPDDDEPFGGIALAFETIQREAKEQKKPFVNHAKHMILHGFLHLLGFDHQSDREARLMERLETAILAELAIPNPYEFKDKTRA
jgi:probable rRNA maturation factor